MPLAVLLSGGAGSVLSTGRSQPCSFVSAIPLKAALAFSPMKDLFAYISEFVNFGL